MIDPLDDDGDLAQARHRVRVLEREVAQLNLALAAQTRSSSVLTGMAAKAEQERLFALSLRDASALEHEREAARRRALEAAIREKAPELEALILESAHPRQGGTT